MSPSNWIEHLREAWRRRHDSPLSRLREAWGKDIARFRDMDLIARYHRLRGCANAVDEQTWRDLAMDEVFARIDRTASVPGRQVLYRQLRCFEDDAAVLRQRSRQVSHLRENGALRERLQLILLTLNGRGAAGISLLLFKPLPELPKFAGWLYLSSAASITCLLAIPLLHALILPLLALLLMNLFIDQTYGRSIELHLPAFYNLHRLLLAAGAIAAIPNPVELPQMQRLRDAEPVAARLRARLRWAVADRAQMSETVYAIFGTLNVFFLFDIVSFLGSLRLMRRHQAQLGEVFEALGELDAAIALASYVGSLPVVCTPQHTDDRRIRCEGLYHPLLVDPVPNSIDLVDRSALITGSNMAGKTTFIRSVGVNLILAQTLNIALAQRAVLPRARLRSSIRREDQLLEGKSYFFAELELMLDFIRCADLGQRHVFLIDEIFRGTNTVERLAASTAVLRHLAATHCVLTTTHDLELDDLLGEAFECFHFCEQIVDGACHFDHRIHAGPVRSRNAIRLLEISGFPAEVVGDARRLAEKLAAAPAHAVGKL